MAIALVLAGLSGALLLFAYWGLQTAGRLDRVGIGAAIASGSLCTVVGLIFVTKDHYVITVAFATLAVSLMVGMP